MGQRSYPKKTVEDFFKNKGLVYKRSNNSHDLWDYPDGSTNSLNRPCTLVTNFKEVPLCHIHTNCITLGITLKDFKDWLKKIK